MKVFFVVALFAICLSSSVCLADDQCEFAVEQLYLPLDRPNQLQQIPIIKKACKPGDTIAIPNQYVYVIAKLCDFGKTIFHDPYGRAVCVLKREDG